MNKNKDEQANMNEKEINICKSINVIGTKYKKQK